MKKKKNMIKKIISVAEKETTPVIIKQKKEIINAVSVVILNDGSEEKENLLKKLQFQKKEYYPETEIVTVLNDNIDLLDLTKGQYIVYFKEAQDIRKDFLHQLYIHMRNGKEFYLLDNVYCIDRKIVKAKELKDITENLFKN